MKHMEYEYKYRLFDDIEFMWVRDFVGTLIKQKELGFDAWNLNIKSTDHYFSKKDDFLRYRVKSNHVVDKSDELTIKKKTTEKNVIARQEVNLSTASSYGDVDAFCNLLGYKFNFSINKCSDVWTFEDVHLSHYSVEVFLGNPKKMPLREVHFVEVEIVDSMTKRASIKILNKWEKLLKPLGITKNSRVNESIFEMYRCSTKKSNIKKQTDRKLLNRSR